MANPENKKLWKIIFITLPLLTLSTFALFFIAYLCVRRYAQSGYERLMLNLFPAYTAFSLLFPLSSLIGVLFKKVFHKR